MRDTTDPSTTPISGPNKIYLQKEKGQKFFMPKVTSPLVALGDSNLQRITQTPSNLDIQIVSLSGGRFTHFCTGTFFLYPQPSVTHLIFSCGINQKDTSLKTIDEQLRKTCQKLRKFFPNASIFIPLLNWAPSKGPGYTETYKHINNTIPKMKKYAVQVLPPLPESQFHTTFEDGVLDDHHWSEATANRMLASWVNHLN